jgi:hypothetical protein
LYLEAAAQTGHVNYSLLRPFLPLQFLAGRLFASARVRGWPLLKRVIYAGGSPLLPLVRLRRILRDVRRMGLPASLFARVLPVLMLGLGMNALGELTGYLFGAGRVNEQIRPLEVRRMDFVNESDRRKLFEEAL